MASGAPHEEIRRHLQQMDPYEFEEFVAEVWEAQGYQTTVRQGSGDRGIDVVATKESPFDEKVLIQAKRYGDDNKVGSQEVREYATLYQQVDDVDTVVIVTTGGFTSQAKQLARSLDVKTIDGESISKQASDNLGYPVEKRLNTGSKMNDSEPSNHSDIIQSTTSDLNILSDFTKDERKKLYKICQKLERKAIGDSVTAEKLLNKTPSPTKQRVKPIILYLNDESGSLEQPHYILDLKGGENLMVITDKGVHLFHDNLHLNKDHRDYVFIHHDDIIVSADDTDIKNLSNNTNWKEDTITLEIAHKRQSNESILCIEEELEKILDISKFYNIESN